MFDIVRSLWRDGPQWQHFRVNTLKILIWEIEMFPFIFCTKFLGLKLLRNSKKKPTEAGEGKAVYSCYNASENRN